MRFPVDDSIKDQLKRDLKALEDRLGGDVIFFFGPITANFAKLIDQLISDLDSRIISDLDYRSDKLFFMLTTTGGDALEVERAVTVVRHYYKEVNFVIPDYAYSAGTIFCMSGDNIYMDYFSILGPIDPQVPNKDGKYIPAQGYLEKVNEFIEKSKQGILSDAEIILLNKLDLADLRLYEQVGKLTEDLLIRWLVQYKFKNWNTHRSNRAKKGKTVTHKEKVQAAEKVAKLLGDNSRWRQHGRGINIETLTQELRLEIIDFGKDDELSKLIRSYYALITDYIAKNGIINFVHTRRFI